MAQLNAELDVAEGNSSEAKARLKAVTDKIEALEATTKVLFSGKIT